MQFVMEPKMQELINKCIYNGHTWQSESLSNLAHMYQPKRIVFGSGQQNLMIIAKLDMNEQRATRYVAGYTQRDKKSGMRRLAQNNTAYMEPRLSQKTNFFRQEALRQLHLGLVDRSATLPSVAWPASSAPVAVMPPQPRPVTGQLPAELESRRVVPASTASIIGPLVGERGSLHELVLKEQPRDWCDVGTKQPLLPPPLTPAAVSAKLDGRQLHAVVLCCPGCQTLLSAELPEGMTQVRCDSCSAAPLHVPVAPPKEKRKPGRRNPSHHAPPLNPKQAGRPPTAYNDYMSGEMQVAGSGTSRKSFSQAAQSWPAVRDAAATLAAVAAHTASSGQPRRVGRAPAAVEGGFGLPSNRFVRASTGKRPAAPFYQPQHDDDEEAHGPAAPADVVMDSPPGRGSVRHDTGLSAGEPSADGRQPASAEKAASAQRPSKGPRSAVCCPEGHALTSGTARAGSQLTCDSCEQPVADGASIYTCVPCDYDKCVTCAGPGARRGGRRVNFGDTDAPAASPAAVAPVMPHAAPAAPTAPTARAAPAAPASPALPAAPAAPASPDAPDVPAVAPAPVALLDYDADDDGLNMAGVHSQHQQQRVRQVPRRAPRAVTMAPAARSTEGGLEAQIAADLALYVAPIQAARDQRGADRHAANERAEAQAAQMMDNGVNINPMLRRRDELAQARRQQEAER